MPSAHRSRGQSSVELVALLALVAAVAAASFAAAASADLDALPRAVAHHARLALCVVGGDVCRPSDAARAGLAPCVVGARRGEQQWRATGLFLTGADGEGYAIEHRSDGTVAVTALQSRDLGAEFHAAARWRGAGAEIGARAGVGWSWARTWVFPGEAAARAFLRRAPAPQAIEDDRTWRFHDLPPPDERYDAGGSAGELFAGAEAGVAIPLLTAGRRRALGRRRGPEGTTWVFDVRDAGIHLLGGVLPKVALRRAGGWTLEVTEDGRGRARRMLLSATTPGERPDEEVEIRAHLDPRLPGNAAAARDLLALGERPDPVAVARAHRVGRHLLRHGAIERQVHRVRSERWGVNGGVSVAVGGLEREGTRTVRRLVAAEVVGPGGARRHRRDCLGLP